KAAVDEIRRLICETEPLKPSTRLRALGQNLTEVARHRRCEPDALGKLIRGDLDWIVMKCLEKDRQRRYETASSLAAAIDRHLALEPVTARPPSAFYRLSKPVRRHKLAFSAGAAMTFTLFAGLTISTILFLNERLARQHGLKETRRADEQAA